MLSQNLEQCLHRALAHAAERHHEFATLEHLLLELCKDSEVKEFYTYKEVNTLTIIEDLEKEI